MTLTTATLPTLIARTFIFSLLCHTVPIEMALGPTEEKLH